uniref:Uncharacterized protein n=1 Tax=Chromera velia CCMP2878 TaxID=1169474 RepID=A0A0G4HIZ4_9ALVE|eukprot:Cvel_27970.t1-p1 / transcript=Cvel_27970.t1 / gene=Cvel_27970 / organism=Chromera_velia_CCMP2878 / gene_product=hypothetical protein / transcript_product=hypothetical protein / location=Cvel_scaffold3574:14278-15174(+) / protein_length=299 / sequence_SO=supercontig / SO=protein_coding / is_pseudo=false
MRLPVRHLCSLDDDNLLFCLEGETDVFYLNVSELKGRSGGFGETPEKTFCKVPYIGMPLVVKGGKMGRLVVVVPSDQNPTLIENWVVAPDHFSQSFVPSPVKGGFRTATLFKNSVHVCQVGGNDGNSPSTWSVIPPGKVFPPRWGGGSNLKFSVEAVECPVHPAERDRNRARDALGRNRSCQSCADCLCPKLAMHSPFSFDVPSENEPVTLFATGSLLCWHNLTGEVYSSPSASRESVDKVEHVVEGASAACVVPYSSIVLVGTVTGGVHRLGVGNQAGRPVEKIFQRARQIRRLKAWS